VAFAYLDSTRHARRRWTRGPAGRGKDPV
jgi:hypothetical protein